MLYLADKLSFDKSITFEKLKIKKLTILLKYNQKNLRKNYEKFKFFLSLNFKGNVMIRAHFKIPINYLQK